MTRYAKPEKRHYQELIGEVQPFDGARELLEDLRGRGHPLVLSSSANEDDVEHYVGLLDAGDLIEACTSSADVERTKPEPDLVSAAIEKAGTGRAVMMATRSGT